jgi:hypothetical protein
MKQETKDMIEDIVVFILILFCMVAVGFSIATL